VVLVVVDKVVDVIGTVVVVSTGQSAASTCSVIAEPSGAVASRTWIARSDGSGTEADRNRHVATAAGPRRERN